MSQPQFHTLKVASVARNTRDAVVVTFDLPAALRETFAFRPGQYLTLRTELNGEEVRRSYSICSAPQDGILRVAIKQVDEGVFSSWANRQLQPGQDLEVMAPAGNFTIDFSPEQQRHYVAFAVGSGITRCSPWSRRRCRPNPAAASRCFSATARPRRCCFAKRSKT